MMNGLMDVQNQQPTAVSERGGMEDEEKRHNLKLADEVVD